MGKESNLGANPLSQSRPWKDPRADGSWLGELSCLPRGCRTWLSPASSSGHDTLGSSTRAEFGNLAKDAKVWNNPCQVIPAALPAPAQPREIQGWGLQDGLSFAHTHSPWGLGSALQHTSAQNWPKLPKWGPCQAAPPPRVSPSPREHHRAGSSPLSQRQLMLMQRPLLQVNCVRGKQVG